MESGSRSRKTVVVVDDDRDVAKVIETVLLDEGFSVACLYDPTKQNVTAAIDRLEPHCVLLDGGTPSAYGPSWDIATRLAARPRPIPVIMLTAHLADREEAMLDETERAQVAHVSAVIAKPFDIDRLITAVRNALGLPVTPVTNESEAAHEAKLIERLRAAGAQELRSSSIGRTWATFRAGEDRSLYKIYRWRMADVYFVGRYSPDGRQLEPLGEFPDLEALIVYCLGRIEGHSLP